MANNENKNMSNTMELNSILEEARRNREARINGTSTQAPQATQVFKPAASAPKPQNDDFENDYVDIDDLKPNKKQKKSKGKGVAVAIIVIAVLAVVSFAGYCAFTMFAEFKFPSTVYVSDVCIGGMTMEEAKESLASVESKLADEINVEVTSQGNSVFLTKNDFTYSFNTDEVLEQAKAKCDESFIVTDELSYDIAIKVDNTSEDTIAKNVSEKLNQDAVEAEVTKFNSAKKGADKFTISESKNGVKVNEAKFLDQLDEFFESGKVNGVIEAEVEITEPKYSKEFLQNNIKKLSSFTTVSTNGANGNHNMQLSLKQCNNSIINPGETWSFNKCTGNSNLTSNGYKSAGVIINGKMENGIGGGICQSSTTIYNAALMCGMEVVERECHYYKSSYVDAGRDATVDYGNIDLKMKNIFDYQLFMECYMEGTTLYCNMYGLENDEFDKIKIKSEVTSYFSNGFKAKASRTFYLDGEKVKTESLPNSTYYYSAPPSGSSSGSSNKPSKKPSSSQAEDKPQDTPTPEPDPTPTPEPDPVPTPDPDPVPTPDPDPVPTPDPGVTPESVE